MQPIIDFVLIENLMTDLETARGGGCAFLSYDKLEIDPPQRRKI